MSGTGDPTLAAAVQQYGEQLYSACGNVRGFEDYLTAGGSLTAEQLYEGMDPGSFHDEDAWYNLRQYCRLMSNVVRYRRGLHTHYGYAAVGSHVFAAQRSFWYRYLALLPMQTLLREATRVGNRVQSVYTMSLRETNANAFVVTIQDSEAFRSVSFGSECWYLQGIVTGLLQANGVKRYSVEHAACGKRLRHLALRQYAAEGWSFEQDGRGARINGAPVAEALPAGELHRLCPELADLPATLPALRIVSDFSWKGMAIFRQGEIFDAPACVLRVSHEPAQIWQRVQRFLHPLPPAAGEATPAQPRDEERLSMAA